MERPWLKSLSQQADKAITGWDTGGNAMPILQPFTSQVYALLRIMAGLLFLWHGTQKLFGFPSPPPPVPAFVIYIAGSIELICGFMVMVGLFAGWAAFLCSGLMAFAYWMVHGPQAVFPIQNSGELAALYCFVFLFIASQGSGIWSVDAARSKA
jgi:putative oxidoreductase